PSERMYDQEVAQRWKSHQCPPSRDMLEATECGDDEGVPM
ncbi:hypothetical protein A2U01_0083446, partial [Trifolium medium]|nr:hypothetical protein [Trifolium medium]